MNQWIFKKLAYLKTNYRVVILKLFLLISGMFLMALGIRLYIPTQIGASQVDFSIYTMIGLKSGTTGIFENNNQVLEQYYANFLTYFYIGLTFIAAIFSTISTIKEFKSTKDKTIWINYTFKILFDVIITFLLPQIVNLFNDLISSNSILNLLRDDFSGQNSPGKAAWFFLLAYIIYIVGICLWVKSTWALGPYNSICSEFVRLTKIKYGASRFICDILMILPGVLFFGLITNGDKLSFFFTNFSIATMVFLFLTGPICNTLIKRLDKVLDYNKLTK
ncbi:hypothetical protein SHELI_v1c00500 [Spiroplasma helicoides]|uniref:Transmembrane protein n=1 Tax=Spiroplasma helicoides TaxID=216938 RepID=A0A1B3SJ99_9MOLU|nr:hypothetical protein [Spiroplasma helicoides]AOG60005.1 hypothetical protein SHELI_v1c00500 [Spiroplasma helicoides]